MTTTRAATAASTASVPSISWMIAASMWLVPVFTGFGMTSWIGFLLIGVLAGRFRWVVLAGLNLWVLFGLRVGPAEYFEFVGRLAFGNWYGELDGVLVAMYVVGILYGVHANRVWLGILWGRRELGKPMLGWRVQPALHTHNPRLAAYEQQKAAEAAAQERAARDALHARAAWGFRQVIEREEARTAALVAALAAARTSESASAPTSTAVPSSEPLPMTKLPTSATSLGLPRGPLDVLTASAAELAAIPGIGAARADALVAARATRTFASVDEVVDLLDLPALELLRARPYLGIGPQD